MQKRLKQYLGRKVVVVLSDGSLAGVVAAVGRDEFVLSNPLWFAPDGSRPVDGEAVVPYASINWVQVAP